MRSMAIIFLAVSLSDAMKLPYFDVGEISQNMDRNESWSKSRLWPNAVIPFQYAPTLSNIPNGVALVREAMAEWMRHTCIKFVPRTSEKDYVLFHYHRGCTSDVGFRGVGQQVITLDHGCFHQSKILHELGHIIGFWHEQSRPDRDKYVEIYEENIRPEYWSAFDRYTSDRIDTMGLPYDYESIMHYKMTDGTRNGAYTILPKKKGVVKMGNDALSPLDIRKTNLMYTCTGWTSWSPWCPCDKSCGGGTQERTRDCTGETKTHCEGHRVEKRVCNLNTCPDWPDFPTDFFFGDNKAFSEYTIQHLRAHRHKRNECVLTYDRQNLNDWTNYMFCNRGNRHIDMKWSDRGPIENMKCTHILEPRERRGWRNNYLCLPPHTPYNFTWSHRGKQPNTTCVKWFAKSGLDGWDNNYLCTPGNGTTVHGAWSQWTSWSHCKSECGPGKRHRVRSCSQPAPRNGGRKCNGLDYDEEACMRAPCEVPVCGGKLTGSRGTFASPRFPSNYPNNVNCTWTIECIALKRIYITVTSMDIEETMGTCHFDYLKVKDPDYNGKIVRTFCGKKLPDIIVSTSNTLWISFVSDGEGNKSGFSASWFHD